MTVNTWSKNTGCRLFSTLLKLNNCPNRREFSVIVYDANDKNGNDEPKKSETHSTVYNPTVLSERVTKSETGFLIDT